MLRYVQLRILTAIPILFGLSLLIFALLYLLPGDAIDAKLAEYGASAEDIEELKTRLGLNDPLHIQYLNFLKGALRGDLGESIFSRQPVTPMILEQLPATLQLAFASTLIAVLLGTTMGIIAALNHNTWLDTASMVITLIGVSMPTFWVGLLAIWFFSLTLGWFPVAGSSTWRHLVLPAFVLGIGSSGLLARLTRSSMLEVLRQDYIRTARAKGLRERRIVLIHALRNALIPLVTVIGIQLGYATGGSVIIEIVFGRRGIGQLAVSSILAHDIPVVEGTVMLMAFVLVLTNLVVDILYAVIDPRIRYS